MIPSGPTGRELDTQPMTLTKVAQKFRKLNAFGILTPFRYLHVIKEESRKNKKREGKKREQKNEKRKDILLLLEVLSQMLKAE